MRVAIASLLTGTCVAVSVLAGCSSADSVSPSNSDTSAAASAEVDDVAQPEGTLTVRFTLPGSTDEESDAYNFCARSADLEGYMGSRAKRIKISVLNPLDEVLAVGYTDPNGLDDLQQALSDADDSGLGILLLDNMFTEGCTVSAVIADVPQDQDFYTIQIDRSEAYPGASPQKLTYSADELAGAGWDITLTAN